MNYRKREDEEGDYCDTDGKRWSIDTCRRIRTPEGVNVGWTEFPSLDDALEEWGLTHSPLLEPEEN